MARQTNKDAPENYKGGREVIIQQIGCGWCMDGIHDRCKHELPYYDKLWICGCQCNAGWVPQDVGTGIIEPKPRKKIVEVVDEETGEVTKIEEDVEDKKTNTVRRKQGG